ncbi:MAG: 3-oxoacyl-ACP reductase FabG [Candidatus Riflebacteria bacterium]|nr:3-oxoacyl-ACP reductase FabG [Candidatus Riflebacteria bacterium]
MTVQRTALVSGASRGIGREIALILAHRGCSVAVGYRTRASEAEAVAAAITETGGQAITVSLDVSDSESCQAAAEVVKEAFGGIDILVNNAAIINDASAAGMEDEIWESVLNTVLSGAFYLSRACARSMIRKRWGRIVNISSAVAQYGARGQANYVAAKAGLEGLTRALAIELAPRNILVNAVAPGAVETDMSRAVLAEHGDRAKNRILLERYGTPHEIAAMVGFLCSDDASYITGQVFAVDGGYGLRV